MNIHSFSQSAITFERMRERGKSVYTRLHIQLSLFSKLAALFLFLFPGHMCAMDDCCMRIKSNKRRKKEKKKKKRKNNTHGIHIVLGNICHDQRESERILHMELGTLARHKQFHASYSNNVLRWSVIIVIGVCVVIAVDKKKRERKKRRREKNESVFYICIWLSCSLLKRGGEDNKWIKNVANEKEKDKTLKVGEKALIEGGYICNLELTTRISWWNSFTIDIRATISSASNLRGGRVTQPRRNSGCSFSS